MWSELSMNSAILNVNYGESLRYLTLAFNLAISSSALAVFCSFWKLNIDNWTRLTRDAWRSGRRTYNKPGHQMPSDGQCWFLFSLPERVKSRFLNVSSTGRPHSSTYSNSRLQSYIIENAIAPLPASQIHNPLFNSIQKKRSWNTQTCQGTRQRS